MSDVAARTDDGKPWSDDRDCQVAQGRLIVGQAGWLAKMAAAFDISHATDALSKIGWSCTAKTAAGHNTKKEPYPLWIYLLVNYVISVSKIN